jgi:hypothetical protein
MLNFLQSAADCRCLISYSQPGRVEKTGITPTLILPHQRLCHNSSSRPSPVERGASRDPEVREMLPFPWIPDLAMLRVARPE